MSHIDIGFSENCESWEVKSPHFPSKIGGKPAWLHYTNLPTFEELKCEICAKQLIFLCQVYAPYEESEDNFHRTVFVFMCKTKSCSQRNSNKNVKVFRDKLARENDYYGYEPPKEDARISFSARKWVKLCELCGCLGEKNCSKCSNAIYCCREHQVIDWKENHKNICGNSEQNDNVSKYLFKESEIVIEAEDLSDKKVDEAQEMANFEKLQSEGKAGTLAEINETELDEHASVDKDKTFSLFLKRVAQNPDQILRYQRGGEPLWIARSPKPEIIPNCDYCQSPRQYEFQIMPQLLTLLQENELDFGVLIVYTCKNSCSEGPNYKNEFIFRQDVTDNE